MFWHSLGKEIWFPIVIWLTGAIGRGAKAAWPSMPAWALQAMVLASGYLLLFVDLVLDGTAPVSLDAQHAAWGFLLAGGAIAGHEVLKKFLVGVLSLAMSEEAATGIAEAILGKLEARAVPPPAGPSKLLGKVGAGALVAALSLALGGCAAVADVTGDDDVADALARCRQEARDAFYEQHATRDQAMAVYGECKRREGLQ